MKIRIYTYADKRPDFIPYQYKSLLKFIRDDFEYTVFDNSSNWLRSLQIAHICNGLGVACIKIEDKNHKDPAIACAHPIQWSFETILRHQDENIVCIIDSDMFLIRDFSISSYLDQYDIAGCKQLREHVRYLWNGILFMNMDTLPDTNRMNFMCGSVEGVNVDVGGHLYYWLKEHPGLRIRNIQHTSHIYSGNHNMECLPTEILKEYNEDYRFEIYEKAFLHYGRGSNWDGKARAYHRRKTELLRKFVDGCMQGTVRASDHDYVFSPDEWTKA